MPPENIAAFTPPGFAPPFVSINKVADGKIEILVRGEAVSGDAYGPCASIKMSRAEFAAIVENIAKNSALFTEG